MLFIVRVIYFVPGLNRYRKKIYKKTKNLLTGSTEQDEEYQKVRYIDCSHYDCRQIARTSCFDCVLLLFWFLFLFCFKESR
jgi:hypothetical protein